MPQRITAETLKSWIDTDQNLKIIDVRDGDRFGGHVVNSINEPSLSFARNIDSLKEQVKDADKVVFYCQLSQQRGPSCASLYERRAPSHQSVHVLDEGFQNWAYTYGGDSSVTERFMPELYR